MSARACFGIACPSHGLCDHYAAVDRMQPGDQATDTCVTWDHRYPRFSLAPTFEAVPVGIDSEGGSHD